MAKPDTPKSQHQRGGSLKSFEQGKGSTRRWMFSPANVIVTQLKRKAEIINCMFLIASFQYKFNNV